MSALCSQLSSALLVVALSVHSEAQAQPLVRDSLLAAPCVISIAHGRNSSTTDSRANAFWNAMNEGIQRFLGERLEGEGVKIFSDFFSVDSDDTQAKAQRLAQLVDTNKCTFLLQVTVYAPRGGELIVDLTLNRLAFSEGPVLRRAVRIGDLAYSSKRNYDSTGDFSRTFTISEFGKKYAEEMLASPIEP